MSHDPLVLSSVDEIIGALNDERLVPPPVVGSGAAIALRAEMARFSPPSLHSPRRAAVEAAIASIDLGVAATCAARITASRLERARRHTQPIEVITTIGRPVAVATIATIVGTPVDQVDDVVHDIDALADVIGRGGAPSGCSDEAVDRLRIMFDTHPLGCVAVVSMLYQAMDATAALVAARLVERQGATGRPVPVSRTLRVATDTAVVGRHAIAAGTPIVLEIGAAGLWFGAGPHACPGRALAEAIADAIVDSITASGATVDARAVEIDADRRPLAVWLRFAGRSR